jgi:uncharacterized protein (DUF1800 family)
MSRSPSTLARYLALLLPPLAVGLAAVGLASPPGAPDIQVFDGGTGGTPVPVNGTVTFATTAAAVAQSKTFTVKNSGTADLLVSEAIAVPQGFTLMASFPAVPNALLPGNAPAYTIPAGASASFTVALNSAAAGNFAGTVSFATNVVGAVPSKNPFVFNVVGKAVPSPSVRYIDEQDAGCTLTSGWGKFSAVGASFKHPFQQSLARVAPTPTPGTPTETATWTFSGLEPGQYTVSATWVGFPWAATNTPFSVFDGSTNLTPAPLRVDQTRDAAGLADGASVWQGLGTFTVTGSTLVVQMTNDANAMPDADGVRVERAGYGGAIVDDSGPGFTTRGTWILHDPQTANSFQGEAIWTAPHSPGGRPPATATWTFAVAPGTYRVMAGFNGYSWAATDAPYSVFDGTTNLTPAPVLVDQTTTPGDLLDARAAWKDLGFYTVTGTSLSVQLSNQASGQVSADAVRVERVNTPTTPSVADTVRLLEQATWGPTPALITQVQGLGLGPWLDQQFAAASSSYPTLPLYNTNDNVTGNTTTSAYGDPTVSGNPARSAELRDNYTMYPLQNRLFTNALYGNDQLRQRLTWALHKIWVISGVDIRQPSWVAPYLQTLNNNAFGNYRTLMYQVTLNPGMGAYLNMAGSSKAAPNENYPREIMQLFTIGLVELNPDGSQKLTGTPPAPIPTYDQNLVDNMTKVFTGWNFAPAVASGIPDYIDPLLLGGATTENPRNHDFTQKALLRGFVEPARTSSVANAYLDLNEGLDNIYAHPNLAPFICKQLIQQLVTSNPSPAYVARVVDTFQRNSTNANQLREVVRAILLDPEARGDRKSAANYGHLKEPVLYICNLMRMFNALSADRTQNSDGYLDPYTVLQGQDAWRPPSVFSYFAPGVTVPGSGPPPLTGPEFGLMTTSTAIQRANFVNQCFAPASGRTIDVVRAAGTSPSGADPNGGQLVPTGPLGTSVDVSFLLPNAGNPGALADQLNTLMLHGTMTPEMKSAVVTAVNAVSASNALKRVRTAVYLVASSSQYQVQR